MQLVCADDEVMMITEKGILIRTSVGEIRDTGRGAAGVRLIRLDEGDHLVAIARVDITEREPEPENGEPSAAPEATAAENSAPDSAASAQPPAAAQPPTESAQ